MRGTISGKVRAVSMAAVCVMGMSTTASATTIIRVDKTSPAAVPDGQSWNTAYRELRDVLTTVVIGEHGCSEAAPCEIWVAGSSDPYKPVQCTQQDPYCDRSESFKLYPHAKLMGGFGGRVHPGNEDTRDFVLYETILSGDLRENDVDSGDNCADLDITANRDDNSIRVVVATQQQDSEHAGLYIDGFTITGGTGHEVGAMGGGGIYIDGTHCQVYNCRIRMNGLTGYVGLEHPFGGGVLMLQDVVGPLQVHIENCVIEKNIAKEGGGIGGAGEIDVTIVNSEINDNFAKHRGGGIYFEQCTGLCAVAGDRPGLYMVGSIVCGNEILEDTAQNGGGGMYIENGFEDVTLENCIVSYNEAAYHASGSGLLARWGNDGAYIVNIMNSIFWGNAVCEEASQIASKYPSPYDDCCSPHWGNIYVSYSTVQDLTSGGVTTYAGASVSQLNCDEIDPSFAGSDCSSLNLTLGSTSVIDHGENVFVTAAVDRDGMTRIIDGDGDGTATVDRGAYEFHCGDGIVDPDEQCDDGNSVNGDGCTVECKKECTADVDCALHFDDACGWDRCDLVAGVCDDPIPVMYGDVAGTTTYIGYAADPEGRLNEYLPNGAVNLTDVLCALDSFGMGNHHLCPNADIAGGSSAACPTGNGIVNLTDYLEILNAWNALNNPAYDYYCDCPLNRINY